MALPRASEVSLLRSSLSPASQDCVTMGDRQISKSSLKLVFLVCKTGITVVRYLTGL